MKAIKWNSKIHRWAAILTALPVLIVMLSGIILQMKKEFDWVQPPTMKGTGWLKRVVSIGALITQLSIWQ